MLVAAALCVACLGNSTFAVQNVSAASTASKALKAYKKVLSRENIEWGYGTTASLEESEFGLLYVNNDKLYRQFIVERVVMNVITLRFQVQRQTIIYIKLVRRNQDGM